MVEKAREGSAGELSVKQQLSKRFRWMSAMSLFLESPMYADLMQRAADDIDSGGPFFQILEGYEDAPGEMAIPLRVFGGAHRMALAGEARELAKHYPSTGGDGDLDLAWKALHELASERTADLRASLDQAPQTNEIGRSAGMMPGFRVAAHRSGLPLRLLELGASAGLNLRFDKYAYASEKDGTPFGDPRSPVQFPREWFEGVQLPSEQVVVGDRAGCDIAPVEASHPGGRLTLLSYVWPDQTERFHRIAHALEIAEDLPVKVDKANACDWIEERLAMPADGVCTVVFHSVFAQYLTQPERDRLVKGLFNHGETVTRENPLAYLRMEGNTNQLTEVRLTMWPGGQDELIAEAGYHGPPVKVLIGA